MKLKQNKLSFNMLKYDKTIAILDIETYGHIISATPYDISIFYGGNNLPVQKWHKVALLDKTIFTDTSRYDSVFYKDKLPIYFYHIANKTYPDIDFIFGDKYEMLSRLNNIITDNGINVIIGYNVFFDYQAINRLYSIVDKNRSIVRHWYKELGIDKKDIPTKLTNKFSKVNFLDLFYVFVELLKNNKQIRLQYFYFCYSNGLFTESGKCISTNEETAYKFLVNYDTNEQHIGYCDVIDEVKLYEVFKQLIKTKQFKGHNRLTLNTQVDKSVYFKGGLFSVENVEKELTDNHLID